MATLADLANNPKYRTFFETGDPDEIFILEEEIASGSFGNVYNGRHYKSGVHYAVKIITPEEDEVLEDFLVEISILKKCSHVNIVGFAGAWQKGPELFIAMELCEGGAVSDIFSICEEGLTEDQIALITRETLKGLEYLHSKLIIHRDLKGANILLTNSGDVKLIDFGVSAELKSPDDKRNTLIGTPYWMAPEVIANKTGNVPYEFKSDMWSLGITLIELAEMNPPLHQIHPMKALMMIPMRDSPFFESPDKWGKDFRDFVTICLNKDPKKRKTAVEMLSHPFSVNVKPKQVLLDLITKRRKAEEKNESDSETDSSESEEESSTVSGLPAPILGSSNQSPSDSPKPQKHGNSKPQPMLPVSLPPQPHLQPQNSWKAPKPTEIKSAPTTPQQTRSTQPSHGHSTSLSSTNNNNNNNNHKATNSPAPKPKGNPNRPTYRTNKKLTKRQIKEQEQKIVSQQLLQAQLKEIRGLRQKQAQQSQKVEKKQKDALDDAQKRNEKEKSAFDTKLNREVETLVIRQKNDLSNLERTHQSGIRTLLKTQSDHLSRHLKSQKDSEKHQTKEHKEQVKQTAKEFSLQKKEMEKKKTPKKDIKASELRYEQEKAWTELLFSQKLERQALSEKFTKQQQQKQQEVTQVADDLVQKHKLAWEQILALHKLQTQHHKASHENAVSLLKNIQPLEIKHLQERQETELNQLAEQQRLEKQQQANLLREEQGNNKKELKKRQRTQTAELQKKLNAMKKEIKGKEFKEMSLKMKDELRKEQGLEEKKQEEEAKKQMQEEDDMVTKHQFTKNEQKKQEHEEELKQLQQDHEVQINNVHEEYQKKEKELIEQQKKELEQFVEAQIQEALENQSNAFKSTENLLKEFQQEYLQLHKRHHEAQNVMKNKQKAPSEEINSVQQTQKEELEGLRLQELKETENLQKQNELARNDLTQKLNQQKKQMLSSVN